MIILKNQTASPIYISGVDTVPASSQLTVDPASYRQLSLSNVFQYIWDGSILVNDGTVDIADKNIAQLVCLGRMTVASLSGSGEFGEVIVSNKKPSGNSFSVRTHNFCDNSTWDLGSSDSTWKLEPPSGTIYKVLRSEVQFTHDIQLASLPGGAKKMFWEVFAGGVSQKLVEFKDVFDIFDWANAHYTMTPTVDGIPGVTTAVFDYADAIVLNPAYAMRIEMRTEDHVQLGGLKCTASFVVEPVSV